jgi:queuine tRNA-ribosyltransferase
MYLPLRLESIKRTEEIGFEGLAIGGLSVGEPKEIMLKVLDGIMPEMPEYLPRYLMGVGTPQDLFYGVERGIDMFDCVHPTRIARHATVFSRKGRVNLFNSKWKFSDEPIDETCDCYACRTFSRGYLRHLFKAKEILGLRMASLHNVRFMINLMNEIRVSLMEKRFIKFKNEFFSNYFTKER